MKEVIAPTARRRRRDLRAAAPGHFAGVLRHGAGDQARRDRLQGRQWSSPPNCASSSKSGSTTSTAWRSRDHDEHLAARRITAAMTRGVAPVWKRALPRQRRLDDRYQQARRRGDGRRRGNPGGGAAGAAMQSAWAWPRGQMAKPWRGVRSGSSTAARGPAVHRRLPPRVCTRDSAVSQRPYNLADARRIAGGQTAGATWCGQGRHGPGPSVPALRCSFHAPPCQPGREPRRCHPPREAR